MSARMTPTAVAADTISAQCSTLASCACDDLLRTHVDMMSRFGDNTKELWHDHLHQRLMELAAALTADDVALFTSRLAWSRAAMQARGLTTTDLDDSIGALRTAIQTTLPAEPAGAALEFIDQAAAAVDAGATSHLEPFLDPGIPTDKLALQYVNAVAAGNTANGMQMVVDAVNNGLTVQDAFLNVLLPAQREVGRLWHLNELSVAEEHLVSYTTQRVMVTLTNMAEKRPDNGLTAVAGAVAGNIHDIGIRAIAYMLELEGWRVIYLGSDVPQVELPEALDAFSADLLLLSVALTSQLDSTERSIERVKTECSRPVKVLVGGNGLAEHENLWQEIGADGYATDVQSAIDTARALTRGA